MRLPYRNIIIATNENNTLDTLLGTGIFKLTNYQHTDSSAQDVRMPSNVWRYFALLFDNDTDKIAQVFEQLMSVGYVDINKIGIVDQSVWNNIMSSTVTAETRARTIKKIYEQSSEHLIIDPHTANGIAAIEQLDVNDPDVPMISMETAKPFKFNEAIEHILGILPPRPARFENLEEQQADKKLFQVAGEQELMEYIRTKTNARSKA